MNVVGTYTTGYSQRTRARATIPPGLLPVGAVPSLLQQAVSVGRTEALPPAGCIWRACSTSGDSGVVVVELKCCAVGEGSAMADDHAVVLLSATATVAAGMAFVAGYSVMSGQPVSSSKSTERSRKKKRKRRQQPQQPTVAAARTRPNGPRSRGRAPESARGDLQRAGAANRYNTAARSQTSQRSGSRTCSSGRGSSAAGRGRGAIQDRASRALLPGH